MLKFSAIIKDPEGPWRFGAPIFVRPEHVIAVEKRWHKYSPFRHAQTYSVLHLSTGETLEVFTPSESIAEALHIKDESQFAA